MKLSLDVFLSRLNKTENGCWISPYRTTKVMYNGKYMYIVLAVFEHFNKKYNGKISRSCRNRRCFNPDHLSSLSIEERFWSNVNVLDDKDKCWEWKTFIGTKEYVETRVLGKNVRAHRLAYKIAFGDFDESLLVCHKCDNPPCCNPHHLFLGTLQDNVDDMMNKHRNKSPKVKGEDHGNSKLRVSDILEIREKYSTGKYSYNSLAKEYGITFGHIRNIVKHRAWSHI